MTNPPPLFDRALHRLRLDRAAPLYGSAGFLKARAAADAVERLEAIMRSFPLAVDLGAGSPCPSSVAALVAVQRDYTILVRLVRQMLCVSPLKQRPGQYAEVRKTACVGQMHPLSAVGFG
jgi:hypothetical protein